MKKTYKKIKVYKSTTDRILIIPNLQLIYFLSFNYLNTQKKEICLIEFSKWQLHFVFKKIVDLHIYSLVLGYVGWVVHNKQLKIDTRR